MVFREKHFNGSFKPLHCGFDFVEFVATFTFRIKNKRTPKFKCSFGRAEYFKMTMQWVKTRQSKCSLKRCLSCSYIIASLQCLTCGSRRSDMGWHSRGDHGSWYPRSWTRLWQGGRRHRMPPPSGIFSDISVEGWRHLGWESHAHHVDCQAFYSVQINLWLRLPSRGSPNIRVGNGITWNQGYISKV